MSLNFQGTMPYPLYLSSIAPRLRLFLRLDGCKTKREIRVSTFISGNEYPCEREMSRNRTTKTPGASLEYLWRFKREAHVITLNVRASA